MNSIKLFLKTIIFIFFATTINGQVTVGPMVVGQGVTAPNDWLDYVSLGIYVDVNTSACGFQTTPHYLVTLESITNSGYHWYATGTPSIYNPTPTGFRVYLRWTDTPADINPIGSTNEANPLRVQTAIDKGWTLKWTGIQACPCEKKKEGTVKEERS